MGCEIISSVVAALATYGQNQSKFLGWVSLKNFPLAVPAAAGAVP